MSEKEIEELENRVSELEVENDSLKEDNEKMSEALDAIRYDAEQALR